MKKLLLALITVALMAIGASGFAQETDKKEEPIKKAEQPKKSDKKEDQHKKTKKTKKTVKKEEKKKTKKKR